jgi:hypothetical protein
VVQPIRRLPDGSRVATLRQRDHAVAVEWLPTISDLGEGSTVRVKIVSNLGGAELVGAVTAGDCTVEVGIYDQGRERVRRTYQAPRLEEVDLLERALEDNIGDSVSSDALAMAGRLIPTEPAPRGTAARRRRAAASQDEEPDDD